MERFVNFDDLYTEFVDASWYDNMDRDDVAIPILETIPIIPAVPLSELLQLRDNLYDMDGITMRGLRDLNILLSKYDPNSDWS